MAKNCGKQTALPNPASPKPPAFYRLHNLLHTVRFIAQHEDDLCCLFTEIGSSGEVTPAASEELRTLLEQMSAIDYQNDLNAVWRSLSIVPPQRAAKAKPKSAKARKSASSKKPKKKTATLARRTPRTRAA